MAYYVVRLYSGSSDRTPEQVVREAVDPELRPALQNAGGLQRYITFVADDGRLGSSSVYESREAAQKGLQVAREWAGKAPIMQSYRLSQTMEGEILQTYDGDTSAQPAYGVGRMWQTQASSEELLKTIEQSSVYTELKQVKGWRRTVMVSLQDGRAGTFASFDSTRSRDEYAAKVKQALAGSDEVRRMVPTAPEEISVRIISSTGS